MLAFAACHRNTPTGAAADATAGDARRFVLPTDVGALVEARRVVSLTPDVTETLLALGGGPRLVGVSSMESARPELTGVVRMGSQVAPDMAAIEAAHPDLVLVSEGPVGTGLIDGRAAGLVVESASFEGRARYAETVTMLARRIGRPAAGPALLARIDREMAAVRQRVVGDARPKVVLLLHREPMVVAGPNGFADELLAAAGGRNAATNTNLFPIVGAEMIVAWAPDVIIDLTPGAGQGIEALIPGLVTRRVIALQPDGMLRPGPHAGEAAGRLFDALHPR
jgi:iron complex transport system substrate-binding protein